MGALRASLALKEAVGGGDLTFSYIEEVVGLAVSYGASYPSPLGLMKLIFDSESALFF